MPALSSLRALMFLFHTGSIRGKEAYDFRIVNWAFLFHTGSIRGNPRPRYLYRAQAFLFHTGSIRGTDTESTTISKALVSIPYWFD